MSSAVVKPRLCCIARGASGYGFHLHGEKGKSGHHIRKVETGSPADIAGLKENDKIIEVNGKNVENETHMEVVSRIKEKSDETNLLVVDDAAEKYFRDKNMPITAELLNYEPSAAENEVDQVENGTSKELRPRQCHLVRGSSGFGFNLHSEKGKQGSYIRSVETGGPSDIAGLKGGDRIVEINGKNMEYEKHTQLVAAIKESGSEVDMLVVDEETDQFFKSCDVRPATEHLTGPLPSPRENDAPKQSQPDSKSNSSGSTSENAPPGNGTDLPNLDLATLKEMRKSKKKAAPRSNWNNRQAMFNNL